MPSRSAAKRVMCLMLALSGAPALAHTGVAGTVPKTGSVLEQSPPFIEIKFRAPASMTSIVVVDANKHERKLEFAPVGSATSFKVQEPKLAPGRNEIQWKALSTDGHVIGGSVILTINSAATKTN